MNLCRNITVSSGLTSECQQDQLFSSACSKIGSLDDLFSSHNMLEGENDDVSLEWLSIFVEDCLTSSGNCLPVPVVPPNITNEVDEKKKTSSSSSSNGAGRLSTAVPSKSQSTSSNRFDGLPNKFVIASGNGARSKRKRILVAKSKSQVISSSSWSGRHIPPEMTGCCSSVDPPLLQQAYWLADSELILSKKDDDDHQEGGRSRSRERSAKRDGEEVVVLLEEMVEGEEEKEVRGKEGNNRGRVISNGQQQREGRRCSHCLAQRTPQWRAGPLGPKTLCNACGVRYKSGRLLPEYRPAKSPTFVSYLHSNSHKKVLEMRHSILSSHSSS